MKRSIVSGVIALVLTCTAASGVVVVRARSAAAVTADSAAAHDSAAAVSKHTVAADSAEADSTHADSNSAHSVVAHSAATKDSGAVAVAVANAPAGLDSAHAPSVSAIVAERAGVKNESRITRIFSAMSPREAAKVLEQMTDADVANILSGLPDKRTAEILALMPAARSAAIARNVSANSKAGQ